MDLSSIVFLLSLVVLNPEGGVKMVQMPPGPPHRTVEACNAALRDTFGALGFEPSGRNEIGGEIMFRLSNEPGVETPHRLYAICAQAIGGPAPR